MRRRSYLALVATGAVCLSALAYLLVPQEVATLWRGYRILLVEEKVDEEEVLGRLDAAGLRDVITESTEPVQISDYSGITAVGLGAARQRLIAGDPRNDSYLDGLARWFRADVGGAAYRVFYLAAAGSAAGFSARIGRALEGLGGAWLLPEGGSGVSSGFSLVAFCGVLCAALLLSLSFRKRREGIVAASTALPWLLLSAAGFRSAAMAAPWMAAVAFASCRALSALDEYRLSGKARVALRVLAREWRPAALLLLPALGIMGLEAVFAPSLACALASSLLAFAFASLGYRGKADERKPFMAMRIGTGRDRVGLHLALRGKNARLSYLASFLVIMVGLVAGLAERGQTSTPRRGAQASTAAIRLPQPRLADGRSFASRPGPTQALALVSSAEDELVNMADWLVHRWYQEALFYLPLKERPVEPFSTVSVPLPASRDEVSMVFDEGWAREAYRTRPRGGVESLLLGEDGFARCFYGPLSVAGARPLAPMEVLLYIILLAPPSVGAFSLAKSGLRDRREHRKAQ